MSFYLKYEDIDAAMNLLQKACCSYCDNNDCEFTCCFYLNYKNNKSKILIKRN